MRLFCTIIIVLCFNMVIGQSISGQVKILQTSEPIEFASVRVYQNNKVLMDTFSDIDGNYKLYFQKPGTYTIESELYGYKSYKDTVNVFKNITDHELFLAEMYCPGHKKGFCCGGCPLVVKPKRLYKLNTLRKRKKKS